MLPQVKVFASPGLNPLALKYERPTSLGYLSQLSFLFVMKCTELENGTLKYHYQKTFHNIPMVSINFDTRKAKRGCLFVNLPLLTFTA